MRTAIEPTSALGQEFEGIELLVDPDVEGWTRTVFSPYYREEREWMRREFEASGLRNVHVDGFGNILGTLPGKNPSAPPIVLGSHTDTVERGGRFDGIVGVLGALEVARRIQEGPHRLEHPLMVVDFFGEEANPFGLTCLGSRALVGNLSVRDLQRLDPSGGKTLGDAMLDFGLNPAALNRRTGRTLGWHAYLELHIEQSTALEEAQCSIGVVTAIAGIKRLLAKYLGQYDHAGGARMRSRRDAVLAAASSALAIHQFACANPGYAVATTTHIDSLQTAQNVVPGQAHLRAEARSTDAAWLASVETDLARRLSACAEDFGCSVDLQWFLDNQIVRPDTTLQQAIASASRDLGLSWTAVPSGATHDSVHISKLAPMGMIFVPSKGGRSHCPEELTLPEDILNGIAVLEETTRVADSQTLAAN